MDCLFRTAEDPVWTLQPHPPRGLEPCGWSLQWVRGGAGERRGSGPRCSPTQGPDFPYCDGLSFQVCGRSSLDPAAFGY